MKFTKIIYTLLLNVSLFAVKAQTVQDSTLQFSHFLKSVADQNLTYAAEKFNVKIAEAQVIHAGIIPDPEIGFEFQDNSQKTMQLGRAFVGELGWTIEMGGKRRSRIELARTEKNIAELALIDYFQNLRAEAALLYVAAMGKQAVLEVQQKTFNEMLLLAHADSIRHDLGEIAAIDAEQSRLEVYILRNDLWQAETDWINSFQKLFTLMGMKSEGDFRLVANNFDTFNKNYHLPALMETAMSNRIDLALAKEDIQLAERFIQLAKANRKIDLGLHAGIERNTEATNTIAETPAFTAFKIGVSVPLKFSNRRSAELTVARYENQIRVLQLEQMKIDVESQVNEAYNDYKTKLKQAKAFENDLIKRAEKILDGKKYSYQRGEISLLEVIHAQRTYNDVIADYYESLYERAVSFINLQRVCGIWEE